MKLSVLNSTQELLEHRLAWNDLWQRSDCTWPTMRAEPLAQWIETFTPGAALRILTIEDKGALLAALPLVEDRWGFLRIGKLPGGDLCSVGDLLVDRDCLCLRPGRAQVNSQGCQPLDPPSEQTESPGRATVIGCANPTAALPGLSSSCRKLFQGFHPWLFTAGPSRAARHPATSPTELLVEAIASLRWPIVRFDVMFPDTPRWRAFLSAAEGRGLRYLARHRGVTGTIEVRGTWDAYFTQRSRNHRRHMRVVHKRATEEGKLELRLLTNSPSDEIESILRRGFEVEDRGWKGQGGSSTLRDPGAFEYFVEQAKLLSASGHLLLAFLDLNDQSFAFEYGWLSKGVYHSLKVGFDETYHRLSPGQLLRYLMMERIFREGDVSLVDYLGPLSDATGKWATRTYPVSRLILANGMFGRALLKVYQSLKRDARIRSSANLVDADPIKRELRETALAEQA